MYHNTFTLLGHIHNLLGTLTSFHMHGYVHGDGHVLCMDMYYGHVFLHIVTKSMHKTSNNFGMLTINTRMSMPENNKLLMYMHIPRWSDKSKFHYFSNPGIVIYSF